MNLDEIVVDMDYYNHRVATPNWVIEEMVIPFTDLTYILGGEAEYTIDGNNYLVRAGDLLCIPPGSRRIAHTFPGREVESQCLNIFITTLDGSMGTLPLPLISPVGDQPDLDPLFRELKAAWLMRNAGYRIRVRALTLLIIEHYLHQLVYSSDQQITDRRIKRVIDFVVEHYADPISVPEMAELANLNPTYFGVLFKQQTGLHFRKYINSIRMNNAENLLASVFVNLKPQQMSTKNPAL